MKSADHYEIHELARIMGDPCPFCERIIVKILKSAK